MLKDNNPTGFAEAFGTSAMTLNHPNLQMLADQTTTLAILLEHTAGNEATKDQISAKADHLMGCFGNLGSVLKASIHRLAQEGMTDADITLIKIVLTAELHSTEIQINDRDLLSSWDQLVNYLQVACAHDETEQFRILFLDQKNYLIANEEQARGTVNHVPVYPREIAKRALELNASAIILVHNHPSGDTTPSPQDINMTQRIITACDALDIKVHDHIIVGKESDPYSFRAECHI